MPPVPLQHSCVNPVVFVQVSLLFPLHTTLGLCTDMWVPGTGSRPWYASKSSLVRAPSTLTCPCSAALSLHASQQANRFRVSVPHTGQDTNEVAGQGGRASDGCAGPTSLLWGCVSTRRRSSIAMRPRGVRAKGSDVVNAVGPASALPLIGDMKASSASRS